ncbi:MAG: FAD-binding oxidoreductase [Candidatus Korobacteraceae bacterium]
MSTATMTTRFAADFRAICGTEHVTEDPAQMQAWNILGIIPALAVTPASADEVAGILRFANEHGLSVVPAGGFTRQQVGNLPPQIDVLLFTTRLTAVEHYDVGDLTVGIGAGCTVAQLSAMVAKDGLFFAGDPAQPERSTIGGLLATGLYGPLRHGYGGLRDYCIGVRFVTGDGRKGKGGGRVVKNVAGYDMMKLFIGSQGTLGIITSASFKLFPAPRQTRTFVAFFPSAAEALQFRSQVLRSPLDPICLELVSPQAHELLAPGSPAGAGWSICVRAAGSETVLARYRTELGPAVVREMEGANEQGFWRALEDFSPLTAERNPRSLLISMTLPGRDVQPVLNEVSAVAESNHFSFAAIGRVGIGHLLVSLWPGPDAEDLLLSFVNTVSGLRNRLPRDVSMAVLHCPSEARHHISAWGPMPTDLESMRAVKMALDPKDILNRGRFLF